MVDIRDMLVSMVDIRDMLVVLRQTAGVEFGIKYKHIVHQM